MLARRSRIFCDKFAISAFLILLIASPALGVTETVLHSFGGANRDGQNPFAGLTLHDGAFYGTTNAGGPHLAGSVFALRRVNGVWQEKMLYAFSGHEDGGLPQSPVVFDANGNLYGTTYSGGAHGSGNGVVFELSQVGGTWKETVLYSFLGFLGGGVDGFNPGGGLIFDTAGNLYGVTSGGGTFNGGTVFKLSQSGGVWTETILYNFQGKPDGAGPIGQLIFDKDGNLYGCTNGGGINTHTNVSGDGTIFRLSPNPDGSWSETVLHSFGSGRSDGARPGTGLVSDAAGNFYGTTLYGGGTGNVGHGTVFQLALANGVWTVSMISNFTVSGAGHFPDSPLLIDSAGNLYGVAEGGKLNSGVLFEVSLINGVWTHIPYYTFPGGAMGVHPAGNLVLDGAGNFYGTTISGGANADHGVVYMLAP